MTRLSRSSSHERPEFTDTSCRLPLMAIALMLLSVVGLLTGNTLGGFTYLLLIIAIALFLLRLAQGQKISLRG